MAISITYATNPPSGVAVSGVKVFFGTQATDAQNDTYVEVGRNLSIPTFGPKANLIPLDIVSNGDQVQLKGINVLGSGDLEHIWDATDAGQIDMDAAQATKTGNWNIMFEYPDAPTPNGTGTRVFLKVVVAGATQVLGTANNPIKKVYTLGYNSHPTYTDPVST